MAAGIIVIVIIALCAILGVVQGGLRTFWSIGCIVASIALSSMLNPMISEILTDQIHLNQYIEDDVTVYLEGEVQEVQGELNKATVEAQNEFIDQLKLPSSWKKVVNTNNTEAGYEKFSANGFIEYAASAIAAICVDTFAFILTFITVFIILQIISIVFKIVDHIPLLKQVNKLVGLIAGFVKGLIIVWLLMIVIAFVGNCRGGPLVLQMVRAKPISPFFYKYNLLATVVLSVF